MNCDQLQVKNKIPFFFHKIVKIKRLKFKVMLQGTMATKILSATQHYSIVATLGSLSNDDGDGNENGKKAIGLD